MKSITTIRFVVFWLLLYPIFSNAQNSPTDSLSLVALYNATDGANWSNSWNLNQPIDTWYGVTLNNNGHVGRLSLYYNQLNGSIPTEIGNLSSLTELDLGRNELNGSIPSEIGNLADLTYLSLYSNQLSASIPPELGDLSNLVNLSLQYNQLSGSIPSELGNLSSLANLNLKYNQLGGNIPPEIGNLNSLIHLDLGSNQLSGNIPTEIGNLGNLTYLYLHNNQLSGCYDINLMNLCNQLTVSSNAYISNGNNFTIAWESFCAGENCSTSDEQSDSLALVALYNATDGANWTNTWNLNQPINTWHGVTLDSDGTVKYLALPSNKLNGNIPAEIGNLNSLFSLFLHGNQLHGSIPPEIGNADKLSYLMLHNNQLSGNIPIELANSNSIVFIQLRNNNLEGIIPDLGFFFEANFSQNKFSQDDIYANYDENESNYFFYSPQYHGEVQSHTVEPGASLTLALSDPLPGNNNQNANYQWKKNGTELVGGTAATFPITNLQISDAGKYTLHITDPTRVAGLEVISEPIYVIVPGYDLYGQPVEYQQLIMEFDDWQSKTDYENNHLYSMGAFPTDSCSCNRLLYLWQFPDEAAAVEVYLDINSKIEHQLEEAEVDGGFNNILNIGDIDSGQGRTWSADYLDNYPDAVTVYMLDSGTDISHWDASPYLINNAPVDICYGINPSSGYDYTDTLTVITDSFSDAIGHGTYGTRSIAEETEDFMDLSIVPLKVFNEEGQGTLFDFICGLYHAIDHDADIINISAGYSGQPSNILENAIALARDKGQFVVTAAGNDGVNIDSMPQYPAYYAGKFEKTNAEGEIYIEQYTNVISVASIDANDELSGFSNHSDNAVTLSAYGDNMGGYSHTGENVNSSGSSMSAYYVTRQLAVEMAKNKNRTYQQIWQDFENFGLRNCPATSGFTSTGKCLDIHLDELPSCRQIDSLALVALYHATNGDNWTNVWDLAQPMGTWYGVTLNEDGCVNNLKINSNNLNGHIPPEIGYLNHLLKLQIRFNSGLSGNIPTEISYLTNLRSIYLDYNNLTGGIPSELVNLDKLYLLRLNNNQLTGSIPAELGDMKKMILLYLYNNQLTGCFNDNLVTLCSQLRYSRNSHISRGNNFTIAWEDFCNSVNCSGDKIEQYHEIDTRNYPNPFADQTTIEYTLFKDSPVTLTIYDASGKQVALLHYNETKTKGTHTAVFESSLHPTGVYYYTIQADEYFGTQKMMLMK